jgi:hypothetical protein
VQFEAGKLVVGNEGKQARGLEIAESLGRLYAGKTGSFLTILLCIPRQH